MLFAMAEHLELPRPWRLMLTAGWNLAESLGIPVAGYFAGAALGGRNAGMIAATAVVWLTVIGRKVVTRSVPGLLTISALVLTLQTAVVLITGSVLFFLLQFPLANLGLCVLFARTAPTRKPLVAQLAARGGGAPPPVPSPRTAPVLPGRDLAVGRDLRPVHPGPGGGDGPGAGQGVHAADHRRHGRRRGRRDRSVRSSGSSGCCAARPARPLRSA